MCVWGGGGAAQNFQSQNGETHAQHMYTQTRIGTHNVNACTHSLPGYARQVPPLACSLGWGVRGAQAAPAAMNAGCRPLHYPGQPPHLHPVLTGTRSSVHTGIGKATGGR